MAKYFESHAHYDGKVFDADREELLNALPGSDVGLVINIGATIGGSIKGIALAKKYPFIFAAVGVHPHNTSSLKDSDLDTLRGLLKSDKVVAAGEIGLDYYYEHSPRDTQRYWFKKQIKLAHEANLPIIVHSRDASLETYEILKESGARAGVVHCFSGSYEYALKYVEMGFMIGIAGVITYKNAKKLVEVAEKIPLTKLLLETDCPYLSPEPMRGKRNDSRNLNFIAQKVADIKGVTKEEVMETTFINGLKLFEKVNAPENLHA
jgi:TatD DNase family protein